MQSRSRNSVNRQGPAAMQAETLARPSPASATNSPSHGHHHQQQQQQRRRYGASGPAPLTPAALSSPLPPSAQMLPALAVSPVLGLASSPSSRSARGSQSQGVASGETLTPTHLPPARHSPSHSTGRRGGEPAIPHASPTALTPAPLRLRQHVPASLHSAADKDSEHSIRSFGTPRGGHFSTDSGVGDRRSEHASSSSHTTISSNSHSGRRPRPVLAQAGPSSNLDREPSPLPGRLPAMPSSTKLTAVAPSPTRQQQQPPTYCAPVVTSPARTVSQPDTKTLSVTSPARRCCFTGGGDGDQGDTPEDKSTGKSPHKGSTDKTGSRVRQKDSATSPRPVVAKVGGSHNEGAPPRQSRGSLQRQRQGTGTSSEPALDPTEDPRVRALVNGLYQNLVTVQPENPLAYLAHHGLRPTEQAGEEIEAETAVPPSTATAMPDGSEGRATTSLTDLLLSPAPLVIAVTDTIDGSTTNTTTTTITTTDTRRGSGSGGPTVQRNSIPSSHSLEGGDGNVSPPRPPLGRGGRSAPASATSGGAGLPVRGHSSPHRPYHSLHGSFDSTLSLTGAALTSPQPAPTASPFAQRSQQRNGHGGNHYNNNSGSGSTGSGQGAVLRPPATFSLTAPARTVSAEGLVSRHGSGQVARTPPSAPVPNPIAGLNVRRSVAGSPGHTASAAHLSLHQSSLSLRAVLGVGSAGSAHSSTAGSANGKCGWGAPPGLSASLGFGAHGSRVGTAAQASFLGSLSGIDRGGATTPSDASSLFSTNSVDLQEFIAELRLVKEECCGGGLERPAITLEELATIMETVSFPCPDGTALLELFDELIPCAHFLAEGGGSASDGVHNDAEEKETPVELGEAAAVAGRNIDAASCPPAPGPPPPPPVPRAAPHTASASSKRQAVLSTATATRTSSTNSIGYGASSNSMSCVTAAYPASSNASTRGQAGGGGVRRRYAEAEAHPPRSHNHEHQNNSGSNTLESACDTRGGHRAGEETQCHPNCLADGTAAHPHGVLSPLAQIAIPTPPPLSDEVPMVFFDTFVARMAFKIQGRYSTEAIRIAFFDMVIDEEGAMGSIALNSGSAAAAAATVSVEAAGSAARGMAEGPTIDGGPSPSVMSPPARGLRGVFSSDSLVPSEPTAASSLTLTLGGGVTVGGSGPGTAVAMTVCTVALSRCMSEGLVARLGMVELTPAEVQRAVRSAGLPMTPEGQRSCECHLEDFARLVRAAATIVDHGFTVSPVPLCLSSLRDGALPHTASTASWKEEESPARAAPAQGVSPMQSLRYL